MKKTVTPPRLEQQNEELTTRNQELKQRLAALEQELAAQQQLAAQLRQEQRELRASETRFRLLANNMSQFAWIANKQGSIFWYNQRWFDYTGMTLEEMQGWGWQKVHHPDHVERVVSRIQKAWDTGEIWEDTFPLRSRDGEYRWFLSRAVPIRDEANSITCWFGTNTDISEYLSSQRALEEAAEFNRTVLESSQDCVKLLDVEGRLEYMNINGRVLLEMDDFEPFKNKFWWDWWSPEMQPDIQATVRTALTGETIRFQGFCATLKGTPKWWDLVVSPVRDAKDKIIRLLVVSRDATKEKLAQQEREELLQREKHAHAQAEAANRAKDEFLAIVSHELRAPLNAMLGWSKILRGGKYKPETLPHALDIIERSARSQQQLIEDLLDSSRIISGKLRLDMQPVDMTMVIEMVIDIIRPAAEAKNITFEIVYLVDADVITGDSERLQQVVWNLVSNAVKFTPNGGHVTIRLERVDPYLQLTVSDSGQGINPEFLPYVFDRFHQADTSITRRFSGLGLGLALVRHLVEMHGGTVNANSEGTGLGASFIINLPLRAVRSSTGNAELAQSDPNSGADFSRVLEGLHILVVDDETDARDLIALMLQQQGAQVRAAASMTEAMSVLNEADGLTFDCMVSDIGMPDNDGYELMRRVRALNAERATPLPAVALTAYGRVRDRIAALSAGFQMHVPKPVEPTELTMVIAGLMGRVGKGMSA